MAEETPNPVPDDQNQKDPLQPAPKTPLEHILSELWKSKVGRLLSLIIGLVAIISLIAPTITLVEQTWDRLTARHKVDSAAI